MSGAALERECLIDADRHNVASSFCIVDSRSLLAGEIAPIRHEGGAVDRGHAVRLGCAHDHVSVGIEGKG